MGLGTTDTVSSMALAMVPPGNVTGAIAEIRRSFWTDFGAASARAYFDYPVLAWLGCPLDGAALAGIAARASVFFELIGLYRRDDDIYLRFPADLSFNIEKIRGKVPMATGSTEYPPGPFESGLGCFCASLSGLSESSDRSLDRIAASSIRAKTYLLAQIELRWTPGPSFGSSWATLSAARAGRNAARA